MNVYVVEAISVCDSETDISLFHNEEAALHRACELGLQHMNYIGNSSKIDYYQEMSDEFVVNNYKEALDIYSDWNNQLKEIDHVYIIHVYSELVEGDCESSDVNNIKVNISQTVSCKQCSRSVEVNDNECWWCMIPSPGKR